jgi:hypothetical protein
MKGLLLLLTITASIVGFGPAGGTQTQAAQKKNISIRDLPSVLVPGYSVDPYITAAVSLQTAGKEKAVETLTAFTRDLDKNWDKDVKLGIKEEWRHGPKVVVLCRLLFTAKPKEEFRPCGLGAPICLGGTGPKDWPLEPIALVGGVPFLVVEGYFGGGAPEPASSYLDYCVRKCDWNTERYQAKTGEEKQKALEKLLASKTWKNALTDEEKKFLSQQIK